MAILHLPFEEEELKSIKAGDEVLITGKLYVGRDQVHLRFKEILDRGGNLPIDFEGNGIYYMGPSPAPDGYEIGACGPTTSQRMDPFSPLMLSKGLRVMVGKGPRAKAVLDAVEKYHGLYLQAFGGCGALYASCVKKKSVVAYPELGPEALLLLEVENFPTICMADSSGNYLPSAIFV
ncbi:MAG: FumA C-terminus/TtdB family hydratase beta subunit [Sphaerochaetaceae bacterium]|nr:FumA C-terminus/TtdB family hydratase beta subunit [Sphaerochaetaceae bacterium]